jgi:hypothetical protein
MRVSRGFLSFSLLTSLILFGLILSTLIFRFAYPPKQETLVGDISQYPPAGHPYSIEVDNKRMYLAYTRNNILIFHWRTPDSAHCRYKWFDLEAAFIDPCTGARFSLDGSFLSGPPHRGLDRYAMRLEGGQIIVDLSDTIDGLENP